MRTIEVLALVIGAGLLIASGAQLERKGSTEWGWLLGYVVGVVGTTTALYLLSTSEAIRIGVLCAGFVLAARAAMRFTQQHRSAR